jgi:hypothetical protein
MHPMHHTVIVINDFMSREISSEKRKCVGFVLDLVVERTQWINISSCLRNVMASAASGASAGQIGWILTPILAYHIYTFASLNRGRVLQEDKRR